MYSVVNANVKKIELKDTTIEIVKIMETAERYEVDSDAPLEEFKEQMRLDLMKVWRDYRKKYIFCIVAQNVFENMNHQKFVTSKMIDINNSSTKNKKVLILVTIVKTEIVKYKRMALEIKEGLRELIRTICYKTIKPFKSHKAETKLYKAKRGTHNKVWSFYSSENKKESCF